MDHRSKILDFFHRSETSISGLLTFKGQHQGPRVIVIGGTHGNEPAGVDAMCKICRFFQEGLFIENGKVDFLIGNPEAYLKDVRYLDFDLNRAFHEDSGAQGIEQERAEEIMQFLKDSEDYDMLVDLHSVSRGDEKILIYRKDQNDTESFVKKMNFEYHQLIYSKEYLTGLLIDIAYERGSQALAVECGNHNSSDAYLVGAKIILKTLEQFEMISRSDYEEYTNRLALERVIKKKFRFVIFDRVEPKTDNFKFLFNEDETIIPLKEGQVYAEADGEILKADVDCFLMMPSTKVKKSDVDAGFFCTRHPIL